MSSLSNYPDRRAVVGALAAVPALPSLFGLFGPTPARAQTQMTSAGKGFPFAVYGDSRPMMYLPSKEGNPDLNQLFVEMFGLVMPEKIAEEVVKRDVKVTFDPVTHELIQIVMPFESKSEVMTLTVDQGWVTEASVEDVKLLPGVHRTMFRLQGGDWVARDCQGRSSVGDGTTTAPWRRPIVMKAVVAALLDERISGATLVTQTLSGAPRRVRLPQRIP